MIIDLYFCPSDKIGVNYSSKRKISGSFHIFYSPASLRFAHSKKLIKKQNVFGDLMAQNTFYYSFRMIIGCYKGLLHPIYQTKCILNNAGVVVKSDRK